MKKSRKSVFTFKDKLSLGTGLFIAVFFGFIFFYTNAEAILGLIRTDPQLLNNKIIGSIATLLIGVGLWLILPVKIRLFLESFIHSYSQARTKFISMTNSNNYPFVLALKLPPTLTIRLVGVALIGIGIYFITLII